MLRGIQYQARVFVVIGLTTTTLLGIGVKSAQARTAQHSSGKQSSKDMAPNLEDNANYFSENRHDIPLSDLKKADALRLKTIASIEELLTTKKKSVRRFELLLRVGELHVERHDFLRDGEMFSYEKAWDAWRKDKKGDEPKLNNAASEAEMVLAANSFRKLANEFPRHPRTDAALYSLARVLARMGKDTSVDYYKQMINSFPKSPLIPDAYLSLGEYYFDKHDIPNAITYYKKVMEFKDNKAYPYAVYKLGWAYYNAPARNEKETLDSYKKATAAFKLVVKLSEKSADGGSAKNNMNLREEAINDLVMVWADAEDVASAWKYFKTIGEESSFYKMLERLGNIYVDQGKNPQAIAVFQRLLKDSPSRPNNPVIHAKLLDLYDLTNNPVAVVAELKRMHSIYLGKTAWTTANVQDKEASAEAVHLCELSTHRYGAIYHQRGQKAKSEIYLNQSAEIYTLYLASFPNSVNAYDIRYYLAEILFDFKQYETASGHYFIVAKSQPNGKYMKPAALNAVAAINQLVQDSKWPQLPPPGQVAHPLEIPRVKVKLIETMDQYVSLLPKEKDGDPMRFTAAQTLFEYGHYPDAIARFDKITKVIPESKQAKASAKVILGYYADKEDWNKVISWGQAFSKQDKLMDADLRKYVTDLLRSGMFKRALAAEKAGKFDFAAVGFLEFQKQFPVDPNADRALFNAMNNYYKVGRIETAITSGKLLLEKYPKSSLVPDVLASIGSTHETLGKFAEAAGFYQRLATGFVQDKRAPNALYNAAVLYKGVKNIDQAISMLTLFSQRYADQPAAPDATLELASLLEKSGHFTEAVQHYKLFASRYPSDQERALYAAAKAASIEITNTDRTTGLKDLERIKRALLAKGSPAAFDARATVAGTVFKLNEPLYSEFAAAPLNDGSKIEKQVGDKQVKLVKLAANYEQIIDLGSAEYSVASLYRLGEAHENFASALFKAPAPPGASQGDIDKIKTELEKVAFPLKEEAYKFFETAYKRSREVETFTVWTRRTYQKMVELAPDKHPDVDELSAEPSYMAHEVKLSKPVAALVTP